MLLITEKFNLCVFILLLSAGASYGIACRDEKDRNIDWYLNYKLPKIGDKPKGSLLENGAAYAYITAPGSSSWKLSRKGIDNSNSMLGNTMNKFYENKNGLSYLFYNDESPSNFSGSSVGHLKGVVAFDKNTGFWLIHSIPKFADDKFFQYPSNAYVNGQSILCVTFKTSELNDIALQLLFSHPNIYSYAITPEVKSMLDSKAQTLFTDNPSFVRREPLTRKVSLTSLGNKDFTSYAKDNQYKDDLYSGLIAPGSKSSLLTETWRRGSGTFLPPACDKEYYVLDIVSINMTVGSKRNSNSIFFKSTEDHSKWAISSDDSETKLVCIADINRMYSSDKLTGLLEDVKTNKNRKETWGCKPCLVGENHKIAYLAFDPRREGKTAMTSVAATSNIFCNDFFMCSDQSQEKRGGGALCFISSPVWKAYRSIIAETDLCKWNGR